MLKYWIGLAYRSLSDPRGSLAKLRQRGHNFQEILMAAAFLSALTVITAEVMTLAVPSQTDQPLTGSVSPILSFFIQFGVIIITTILVCFIGRVFQGKASFTDTFLAMTWLQFVMYLIQVVQMIAFILVPPLGSLIFLVAVVALVYLMVNFVMEIHGFNNALAVSAGVIGGFFMLATILSIILLMLGIAIEGVTENV